MAANMIHTQFNPSRIPRPQHPNPDSVGGEGPRIEITEVKPTAPRDDEEPHLPAPPPSSDAPVTNRGLASREIGGLSFSPSEGQLRSLDQVSLGLSAGVGLVDVNARWESAVAGMPEITLTDVNALVQWVLREAYLETSQDLHFFAEKVKFFNEQKKKIREETSRAREVLAGYAGADASERIVPPIDPRSFDDSFAPLATSGAAMRSDQSEPEAGEPLEEIDEGTEPPSPEPIDHPAQTIKSGASWGGIHDHGMVINQQREDALADLLDQVGDLSPDELAALEEKLRTEGITIGINAESGGEYPRTFTFKKRRNESVEEFLTRAMTTAMGRYDKAWFDRRTGNGIWWTRVETTLPAYTVTPGQGGDDDRLGGGDATSLTRDAAPWVAGQPVDTKAKLEAYIENLEERLNSIGDDSQLANVDLQNVLQKQQQTLQMMSNISKMLHDTALSVIRKIGG